MQVTFEVLDLSASTEITNTTCSIVSSFSDDGLANTDCATATGYITPTGAITGVVWSDLPTEGWFTDPTGYEATDRRIQNVTLELYGCFLASGDIVNRSGASSNDRCEEQGAGAGWQLLDTQVTGSDGSYEFDGLLDGYYYVQVLSTTLPGSSVPTQTGEADFVANGSGFSCSSPPGDNSCDHIWGDLAQDLYASSGGGTDIFNPIDSAETITNVNFGYSVQAAIYGTVWQDHDGDGNREDGDNGLDNPAGGITVTLRNITGTIVATTTTDENGYYEFNDLVSGTYTITVLSGTLPSPAGNWSQTFDPDATCVPTPQAGCNHAHTVSVASGERSGSHDFGYTQSGAYAIGDRVYYDWNGDGQPQIATEEGIPGVLVVLYEDEDGDGRVDVGTDAWIMTATTSITGFYKFTGLVSGTYTVIVDRANSDSNYLPDSYLQTQDPDVDTGACEGSACDNDGSSTVSSTLQFDEYVDFGYLPSGSGAIGDTVWRDMDGDGTQDGPQETGIISITVWLEVDLNGDGTYSRVMTETTDANGKYLFENLPDGDYRVIVDTSDPDIPEGPGGFTYVPSTATTQSTTISGGNTYLDADFGFMPLAIVGDTVYYDSNVNGDEDPGEPGISGVEVQLYNDATFTVTVGGVEIAPGDYISTTTSDGSDGNPVGWYQFAGLETGGTTNPYTYTVRVIPGTLIQTADPDRDGWACGDPNTPSNYSGIDCDNETTVLVFPGTVFLGADFGYEASGVIGDYVWRDLDRDGEQDDGEPGIPGVLVTVTDGDTWTTTTDFDGRYSFAKLAANDTYTVEFQLPSELSTTLQPTIVDTNAITRGVGSVGYTTTVQIDGNGNVTSIEGASCTTCSLHVDSGFVVSGSLYISGTIFYDADGDLETDDIYTSTGLYTDTPYANISVFLYDQDRRIIGITETDANGQYTFTNLIGHPTAGVTYTVSYDDGALQVAGMDVTAAGAYEVDNYHTVVLYSTSVTDVDFGLYEEIDFGDLLDGYRTTVAVEGAGHISGTLYLGSTRDVEGDGVPTGDATGDGADEDGVAQVNPSSWSPGTSQSIAVTVTGDNGRLYGYYDWNDDGDFADSGETVDYGAVPEGTHYFSVTIPATSVQYVNVRFRLFDSTEASYYAPSGLSTNGEVEDYRWNSNPTAVTLTLFEAAWDGDQVLVTWETALEIDTVGFNVWRSTSADGEYERVNATLIPAQSLGGVMGGFYEVVDTDVSPGTVYYYKLEELEVGGRRNWYGPVSTDDGNPASVTTFNVAASSGVSGIWWAAGAIAAVCLPLVALVRLRKRRR